VGGDTGDEGHVRSDGQTTHRTAAMMVDIERWRTLASKYVGLKYGHDTPPIRARDLIALLDEIERLRQLVREAHVLVIEHADDWDTGAWCRGCMWNHVFIDEEADPPWELDEWFDTIDEAHAAHAAHVEAILNGGAK
jgi:hypothetical protein